MSELTDAVQAARRYIGPFDERNRCEGARMSRAEVDAFYPLADRVHDLVAQAGLLDCLPRAAEMDPELYSPTLPPPVYESALKVPGCWEYEGEVPWFYPCLAPAWYHALDRLERAARLVIDEPNLRPASRCLDDKYIKTHKQLLAVLERNSWIRRDKPNEQRLLVHLGDLDRYREALDRARFNVTLNAGSQLPAAGAEDQLGEAVAAFVAEMGRRQREGRSRKGVE
jgi:hypothetical protein